MIDNKNKEMPSADFIDAYKDRVRQLEIENKRMRSQLGLNQHRPVSGTVENELSKVSAKLASKTKKLKEVFAYAKTLETKYNDNIENVNELKEKNSSLEFELKKVRMEKQNKEDCLSYEVEELKKALRKHQRDLDAQKKMNSSLQNKLENLEKEKQQLQNQSQQKISSPSKAGKSKNEPVATVKPKAVEPKQPARALTPLRGQIAPVSTLSQGEPARESKPALSRQPLEKPVAAKLNDTGFLPSPERPVKEAKQDDKPLNAAGSSPPIPVSCDRKRLAPLPRQPSSGLTSLADLPSLGQKQTPLAELKPKASKGKKKSAKKSKSAANMSMFQDDVGSILDSLL